MLRTVGSGININRKTKNEKKLFATFEFQGKPVKFQLDSGATCNVIPADLLPVVKRNVNATRKVLKMYNNDILKPLRQCSLRLQNPTNEKIYDVEFVIVSGCTQIPGNSSIQEMDLVRVQHHNIMSFKDERGGNETRQSVRSRHLTKDEVVKKYTDVFQGMGKLRRQYKLEVEENAEPVVQPPRRVPIALKDKLKQELERLQDLGIITEVTEPTSWLSSVVIVHKPNGQIRVCTDPKDLNCVSRRSHYPTPTIDKILPELARAKVFSTVDVKNGFWHVELDKENSQLMTFNSPFGRYRWCRLPFGVSTAPEEFQRRLNHALEGLKRIRLIRDDILIFGESATEDEAIKDHDQNLHALMLKCQERNVKLNEQKVKLRGKEVAFMGHVITEKGLKPDPEKVKAVLDMPTPTDVASVRRFIGFTNYLSKFLLPQSEVYKTVRDLTRC